MLRPTADELEEARRLGINPEGLNGPQLRERIVRATAPREIPFLRHQKKYESLVRTADLLQIDIFSGDSVAAVKRRIEERLAALYQEKGMKDSVEVVFTEEYRGHPGQKARINNLKVWWQEHKPYVNITVNGKARPISAVSLALSSFVE